MSDALGGAGDSIAEPLMALGDKCLFSYAESIGVAQARIEALVKNLDRASAVYRYLKGLPD